MIAANWGFVAAAYGLSAVVLLAYWRRLVRREHEVALLRRACRARLTQAAGRLR